MEMAYDKCSAHNQSQDFVAFSGKRKSQRLENQRIKRQKIENADDVPTGTKITDINPDCLEHILMYLNLGDLLNVADSNKYLKSVAEEIYVRKYGRKNAPEYCGKTILEISAISLCRMRNYEFDGYSLKLGDLKTCLQFVRCFGHLLHDIILDNVTSSVSNVYGRTLIYINEYCGDHLWFIRIKGFDLSTAFKKPFLKVTVANLIDCGFGKKSLNWLFPNVTSISYKSHGKFLNIDKHMPMLKCLYIGVSQCGKLSNSGKKAIEKAFRLNPQLKRLEINLGAGLNLQLLSKVSKYIQSLEDLMLKATLKKDFCFANDTIYFKSVESFYLNLKLEKDLKTINGSNDIQNLNQTEDELLLPNIPFAFDRLKHLKIRGNCRYSDQLFSFISKCPTINFLQFWDYIFISKTDVAKIAAMLPAVKKILFYERYSLEEVCHYLTEFKLLNEFGFRLKNEDDLDVLRTRFGHEWQISPGFCVDMKRSVRR
ncbi:uncharacterized protein LOC116349731 [Contarinia nasturtii]|uniref:uncharacterized protein LOC116349731 n=1 Tax=Contarinia nasturtii TaxID=265458 RepID=UPI0012D491D7|nr:uncharacterized protein LOC116349731 [Contarinia nasturtii]XP_031637161.1 uncharacterized protein LOC116349731 [Contarinia nasturtii]XP_031637162.1 uncharacterized protein LOC116349731 [Contarinia nasturtii]XP_031637163.1 uncharacterized protein LOC116349731 [Contarinia nasturtii]XP_031637164.1 uncharacterized protein LOC116349731 [Contarinia nasturtii]